MCLLKVMHTMIPNIAKHRLHVCTRLAPLSELGDANQAVLLKGSVLDSGCRGLAGATVDVWYAGGRDNTGGQTIG